MIIRANKPIQLEARNPRPGFRRLKTGDIYTLNIEVAEEDWNSLKTIPENAMLGLVLWHHDGDPTQPEPILGTMESPKPKKEPSAFGYYWSYLFKQGFLNDLDLQEALLSDAAGAHAALRKAFGVEHLSTSVAPAQFEQWIREKGLKESFITMSKNAQVYHLEKQAKAEGQQ